MISAATERDPRGTISALQANASQRALGVVYTPALVTEPMTRLALEPLMHERALDELLALRICDPALGEGAFLIAAGRLLTEQLERAGLERGEATERAAGCLYGVDIDPRAVDAARAALGPTAHLAVADALALDWPAAFPEVFATREGDPAGFDAVIGNPPYVRQEHLAAHKPLLRGFACYDGVADLYVYFVELALRLTRPLGRYCLITPNKWLTAHYARPLRGYLAAQHGVDGVIDLGRAPLFDNADAFPCIVWGTRGAAADSPIRAARLASDPPHQLADATIAQPRARFSAEPWHIDAPDDHALLDRLAQRWPALHALVPERPARGVVTGYNRAFILDRATRDRLLTEEPAAAPLIRPFVKGRDLLRWLPPAPDRWILLIERGTSLDQLPAVRAHLAQHRAALEPRLADAPASHPGRKPGAYRWYELQDPVGPLIKSDTPRLLYQDIQSGPQCCIDRDAALVPDTTVWMLPTQDLYLLAVLNSPLYGWYAHRRFPPALNGSVRPKLAYLRHLPIATPSADARAAIEQHVLARLAAEQACRAGDADAAHAANLLDAAIALAVHDVYELSSAERALLIGGS